MNHTEHENTAGTGPASIAADIPDIDNSVFSDKPAASQKSERFVAFFLDDKLYAIPSVRVAEVIHPLSITPLPGSESWLLGAANLRGEVLAVLNLKKLWNVESSAVSGKAKLVVLRSEQSETPFAFSVDKLSEIVTIFDSEIQHVKEKDPSQICGKVVRGPSTFHLVDTAALIASLAFN